MSVSQGLISTENYEKHNISNCVIELPSCMQQIVSTATNNCCSLISHVFIISRLHTKHPFSFAIGNFLEGLLFSPRKKKLSSLVTSDYVLSEKLRGASSLGVFSYFIQ